MWNRFDHPLRLELGDSAQLLKALVLMHLAGLYAWVFAPLPPALRLLVVFVLVIQFRYLYRVHVRPVARRAVLAVYWASETGWQVKTAGGWRRATLCHPYYVTAPLVAVRFRIGRVRRATVIVVSDRTDADSFRRLRVRLLQCAHGSGDKTQVSDQR